MADKNNKTFAGGALITAKDRVTGAEGSIFFDCVESYSFDSSVDITMFPVEEGVDIADHVRLAPAELKLTVFVTNAPVSNLTQAYGQYGGEVKSVNLEVKSYEAPLAPTPGAVFSKIGSAISSLFGGPPQYNAQVLKFENEFDAVYDTEIILLNIQNDALLCDITTSIRKHENYLLKSISRNKGVEHGDAASFDLTFQKMRIVKSLEVVAAKPKEKRAEPPVEEALKDPVPVEEKKKQSWAYSLTR